MAAQAPRLATAPHLANDRLTLLRLADEAPYRTTETERNRIERITAIEHIHGA